MPFSATGDRSTVTTRDGVLPRSGASRAEREPPVSDPTGPSMSEPVSAAEARASTKPPPGLLDAMDPAARRIAGTGGAVAVIALIGALLGTWTFDWSAIVLIAAGLLAAGTAVLTSGTGSRRTMPIAKRDLILAGGTIAAVLGVLFFAEVAADFDDLDEYGGILGALAALALAVSGVALFVLAAGAWSGSPLAPWTRAISAGDRSAKVVVGGAALVVLGWLGNVTIGVWYLDPGVIAITLVLLAALVVRAAADPDQPLVLPFPVAYVAVVLTGIALLLALQHSVRLADQEVGAENWILQLIYIAGAAIALIGGILGALAAVASSTPAAPGPGGTAG